MNKLNNQRGGVFVLSALLMVILIGFGALAVDLGYLFIVRNELQNAADAAALTGAAYLYPTDSSGNPNWAVAQTKALNSITSNKADLQFLVDGSFQTGYWDLTGAIPALHNLTGSLGPQNVAAVKVTLSKSAGHNGGPVKLFFGQIFGINTVDITVQAIAVVGFATSAPAKTLFPMALAKSLYDQYWDSTKGAPKNDPKTGQPYIFQISSNGSQGQWTTFNTDSNSASAINNLITAGNAIPLNIGDSIWIQSGSKTSVYGNVPINKDFPIAIVNTTSTHKYTPILGFGAIHIIASKGGSSKYVQVQLIKNFSMPYGGGEPGGPPYGVYTKPKLVL